MRRKINSSTVTSKYQTTIPKKIREKLGISAGDTILFDIDKKGEVRLRKLSGADVMYLRAVQSTLSEWESKEDDDAFAHLQTL